MPDFMHEALREARLAVGVSRPNPPVGAIVVCGDRIIARGHTQVLGKAHAEVMALQAAGEASRGADLFVTLEPCCHYGRTPPCTNAIIAAGIKRVFFFHADPNPQVAEKSRGILEAAGIEVHGNVSTPGIEFFYEAYDHYVSHKRVFVELKIAQTNDGFIAGPHHERIAITGDVANQWTHELRAASDAIIVGGGTLEHDDPLLTVRGLEGNNPRIVVFSGDRLFSPKLRIFSERASNAPKPTVYSNVPQPALNDVADVRLQRGNTFDVNWVHVLDDLSLANMHRIMVEPGATLARHIFKSGIWNRLDLWTSPKSIGHGIGWNWGSGIEVSLPMEISEDTLNVFWNEQKPHEGL
jgi:diaminohydroxyphosphoribosylaminopyrimidine deaminase / 5-amino-6-(5-phosphoribosylamino)uracil reductase